MLQRIFTSLVIVVLGFTSLGCGDGKKDGAAVNVVSDPLPEDQQLKPVPLKGKKVVARPPADVPNP